MDEDDGRIEMMNVYAGLTAACNDGELSGNGRGLRDAVACKVGTRTWPIEATARFRTFKGALDKPWRGQGWRACTGDPWASAARSVDFGWSFSPGGSEKQMDARARGRAYRLSAWEKPHGAAFFKEFLKPMFRMAWAACVAESP
eukprot:5578701-Pleurochrysis_carterae.AAC.1